MYSASSSTSSQLSLGFNALDKLSTGLILDY